MQQQWHEDIHEEMRAEMRAEIVAVVASMSSQQNLDDQSTKSARPTMLASTKGSCAADPSIEPQEQPQLTSIERLALILIGFKGQHTRLPLEHENLPFYHISVNDITDLLSEQNWLSITVLQLWCTYIHRLCISNNISHIYAIMDPYLVSPLDSHNSEEVQTYIQNTLINQNKVVYLAPFLNVVKHHFQLIIICPSNEKNYQPIVVWMCSLDHKPENSMKNIVNLALEGYWRTKGKRKKNPIWINATVPIQVSNWECGHYVMRYMLNIVSGRIVGDWEETFTDKSPFSEEVIQGNRELWTEFYLEHCERNIKKT